MRSARTIVLGTALVFWPSEHRWPQSGNTIVVPNPPACARCRIETVQIVSLGDSDGPGALPGVIHTVRVDGQGRYWVLAGDEPPFVFDSSGRFLQRVGRTGRGPGEFVRPLDAISIDRDSMLVVDGALARAVVVGPDLKPSRTMPMGNALYPLLIAKWPNDVVANGSIASAASVGLPHHRVSFAGASMQLLKSFGPDSGDLRPADYGRLSYQLASSRDGFWAADQWQYRITLWTQGGGKLRTLTRAPPWFSEPSHVWIGNSTTPPPPAVNALFEDEAGQLWVMVRVPSPTWKSAWPTVRQKEYLIREIAVERLFHTTIEVINPTTGRVVARRTVPQLVVSTIGRNRVAAYVVEGDVPRVRVLSLAIAR